MMMTIGNVTNSDYSMQVGMSRNMQGDSVSKGIQKQIENAQKKLQDLSSNEEMTLEDKMKKKAGNPEGNHKSQSAVKAASD